MFKTDEDRAVSPVIGVILMVAITVILAAVIAAFVLGIGPGDEPVDGAVDVSTSGEDTTGDGDIDTWDVGLEVVDDGNLQSLRLGGCADVDAATLGFDSADNIGTGDVESQDVTAGTGDGECEEGETINVVGVGPDGGEETVGSTTVS